MRLGLIIGSVAALLCSGVALAEEKESAPIVNSGVSRILDTVSWGATLSDVLQYTEKRLMATWQDNLKELDTIGVDRMRRKMRAEFEAVKKSLVRFDSGATGFESSIVADEMLVGKNESVLQIPLGAQQRYYFFRNDRLWKIVAIRDATRATEIGVFLKRVNEDLGSKATVKYTGAGKERTVERADWRDDKTWASVHDRTSFFNAYLIRFIQIGDGETYQAERKGVSKQAVQASDDDLNDLFAEGEASGDEQSNVVDQMTGSDHAVDLSAGRVDYNPLTTEAEGAQPKKKKTTKKKPKGKIQKKKQKRSDSDDIIY